MAEGSTQLQNHANQPQKIELGEAEEEERDPESNSLQQQLLKRHRTQSLSSNPLALVGAKVSHIESLDYE